MTEPAVTPKQHGGKAARNERRKAASATINAASVAIMVALVLQPAAQNRAPSVAAVILAAVVFVVLQALAHYILDRLED